MKVVSIMDHMGSLLKAEQESEAARQEELFQSRTTLFRVTSMYSVR